MIEKYEEWIKQLEALRFGMITLKDNTQRIDDELVQLLNNVDKIFVEKTKCYSRQTWEQGSDNLVPTTKEEKSFWQNVGYGAGIVGKFAKNIASDVWKGTKDVANEVKDIAIGITSPIIQNNGSMLNIVETDIYEDIFEIVSPFSTVNIAKAN